MSLDSRSVNSLPVSTAATDSSRQYVLLGASNVVIGFRTATRLLMKSHAESLEIFAAVGHGRSYGHWSHFAGRSLPSIVECGLWNALSKAPVRQRQALITDIGNDLIYGRPPEIIASWVHTCVDRLTNAKANCIITRLPLARIERLSALRYHATRLCFFPRHKVIRWSEMLDRVRILDAAIVDIANQYQLATVAPADSWYGFDPIHIRQGARTEAWTTIFSHWHDFRHDGQSRVRGLRLTGRYPEHYRLLGMPKYCQQPILKNQQISLSLY